MKKKQKKGFENIRRLRTRAERGKPQGGSPLKAVPPRRTTQLARTACRSCRGENHG
jgi:hypothetical protein